MCLNIFSGFLRIKCIAKAFCNNPRPFDRRSILFYDVDIDRVIPAYFLHGKNVITKHKVIDLGNGRKSRAIRGEDIYNKVAVVKIVYLLILPIEVFAGSSPFFRCRHMINVISAIGTAAKRIGTITSMISSSVP